MKKALSKLLESNNVKAVFCKLLTKNDDSGKHGIVVPVEVYRMLPRLKSHQSGSFKELRCIFTTWSNVKFQSTPKNIRYKYYHQPSHPNPERRLTNFRSNVLSNSRPKDLFVFARTSKGYIAHFIPSRNTRYDKLIRELGLRHVKPGGYLVDMEWSPRDSFEISRGLRDLLNKFDKFAPKYHPTVNPASEGVGATYEELLGIARNNSPTADFRGIEIKCYKSRAGLQPHNQDLFLKQPLWTKDAAGHPMKNKDIIKKYGYLDELGRKALKVRLGPKQNSRKLYLVIDKAAKHINIMRANKCIGYWPYDIIEKRLLEKHKSVAFIGADTRIKKSVEEFRYESFKFCSDPSPDDFAQLVSKGYITVELRMHLNKSGVVRNHGTQFRIQDSHLQDLYAVHWKLR